MLLSRTDAILKAVVRQYIDRAVPVSSQRITDECGLGVSSATIRNEMAYLEQESYVTRPHTSAGSIPTDKGYRYYVDSLKDVSLPLAEQRLISHLFHQVEKRLEEWLSLTAALIARLVESVAVVTTPRLADCRFKHLELVQIQDSLVLIVLVLHGARVRQQLITLDLLIPRPALTAMASKLSEAYFGLTRSQIQAKHLELSPAERELTDCLVKIIQDEDEQGHEATYLDGWHFMLNQPEFARSHRMLALMELAEQRSLHKVITPPELASHGVQVIIGKENKAEIIRDYSVVISRYGLPDKAVGTIGILGPTRMHYARAISAVGYLASVLSQLEAELYGKEHAEVN